MRGLSALLLLGAAAAAGAVAACQTVDLGTPPADLNACRPSQLFFVSNIWPILSSDYGGKHCYDAGCHDMGTGRPLTLVPIPGFVPDAGMTVPVPLTGANSRLPSKRPSGRRRPRTVTVYSLPPVVLMMVSIR